MYYNSDHATNDTEKANLFARFFASVYKEHTNEDENDAKLLSFINSRNDDGYLDVEISPNIVSQVLLRMD